MRTAERRRIRVLMSLAIAAGLTGLVAYYTSPWGEGKPRGGGKAEPNGKVQDDQRGHRPDCRGEPGGDSRPSPPDGYSFVSYHGEMPRARLEGEVDAGGERSGPDIENVFPDARLLRFDTDNAILQAVAAGEARDNGGESHAGNA